MFRLNSDLYHNLANELWSLSRAGTWLMCILRCNDDHVARKQKHGTAECRLLIELKVVLRMIHLQYEAIALAVAELLLAGDDILDVEKLVVSLEEALAGREAGVLLYVCRHTLAYRIAADRRVVEVGLCEPLIGCLELLIEIVILGRKI